MKHRTHSAVAAALLFALLCPPADAQEVAVSVFKKLAPSVVKFTTPDGGGVGTGFIIHPSGIILTNRHVAAAASRFHVDVEYRNPAGERAYATFKKVDARFRVHPEYDLAICRIDPGENPSIPLVPVEMYDDEVLPGMSTFAIGHPRGGNKSISVGNVSSVDYVDRADPEGLPHTMSTSIVQGGNSGGPVVDRNGRVIGVATFFITDDRGGSALTGCVPRKIWKDFDVFTTWSKVKGNPEQAKRMEEHADRMLKQIDELAAQQGRDHPMMEQMIGQVANLYARALAADPGNSGLMIKVARMLIKFDQRPKAVGMLVEVIDAKPWDQPDAYGLLAIAMAGTEDANDQVLVAAEEGIAKFPRNALAWVGKGEYHGIVKKDWEEAMLWEKVGYDLYKNSADLVSKALIEELYNTARDKVKETGGREPHPQEIESIMNDKIEPAVADAEKAKKAGTRFINSAFEQLVQQHKPEPPPEVASDFDLNKLMAELKANGGGTTTPPIATTPDPTPTPTIPDPPAPKEDADAKWIEGKLGLAKMYWNQRATRPDLGTKALKVLKQIDYRYPKHPRANEARELMKKWASE